MKLEEMLKFAVFLAAASMCIETYPPQSFLSSFSLSFFVFMTSFILLLLSPKEPTNSDERFLRLLLRPRRFSFMASCFSESTAARKLAEFQRQGLVRKTKIDGIVFYVITQEGMKQIGLPFLRRFFESLKIRFFLLLSGKLPSMTVKSFNYFHK